MKNYKVHMDLLNKVLSQQIQNRAMKMVDLEQQIISGLDTLADGKHTRLNNTNLVKAISQISKELNPKDYLRILMIYFVCFDLMPKDKQTMLKSFQKESYRDILQNLELLDLSMAMATKFRRKHPEMTSDELNAFLSKNTKAKYKTLKCEPKIMKLIRSMHSANLDPIKYPYIGDTPQKKRSKNQISRGA